MRTTELIDYLVRRGYDKTFLKTQIQRASDVPRTDALKNKPRTQTETIPFVITYNPALPNIARIIHQHSNVLYSSDRCRNVFKNLPLVAYRRCKNISDILVRAQLTETPESSNSRASPCSFQCNSRNCTTCPYIEHGCNQYTWPQSIHIEHGCNQYTFLIYEFHIFIISIYFSFRRWNVPYEISVV